MGSAVQSKQFYTMAIEQGTRALLISNDPVTIAAFVKSIGWAGTHWWAAGNAATAIRICSTRHFDLVLLDLAVANAVTIITLAKQLRNHPHVGDIILLAGPSDGLFDGMENFIIVVKPHAKSCGTRTIH